MLILKKVFYVLVIITISFANSFAQWIQQDSLVNYIYLNVKFINEKTGWISGQNGTIVKTTNSGLNWTIQKYIPGKLMYGLCPIDSNVIYAVGWFETILKTTNGGSNWIEIQNGPFGQGQSYESVFFINKDTGWITGTGNKILKTTNGGITFDSAYADGRLYDIYFRNANEGLACGQSASMRRTTNGGLDWTDIAVPVGTQADDFYRLTFVDQNIGYTQGVHNTKIYKTTDFGLSWDSVTRIPQATFLSCIFFSDKNTGWSCGDNNQIFKSSDGGISWRIQNTTQFNNRAFSAIYFVNDSVGFCVGGGGKIIYTNLGGELLVSIENNISQVPKSFGLFQNYPNPFNSVTKIRYEINQNSNYKLEIFNNLGQLIEILFNEFKTSGDYEELYNAYQLSSGIYFYRLSGGSESQLNIFLLIK